MIYSFSIPKFVELNNYRGVVGLVVVFGAEGCWFDSTSSRHVGTLGKSFARNCLYD